MLPGPLYALGGPAASLAGAIATGPRPSTLRAAIPRPSDRHSVTMDGRQVAQAPAATLAPRAPDAEDLAWQDYARGESVIKC